jgi:hypothetical protein
MPLRRLTEGAALAFGDFGRLQLLGQGSPAAVQELADQREQTTQHVAETL